MKGPEIAHSLRSGTRKNEVVDSWMIELGVNMSELERAQREFKFGYEEAAALPSLPDFSEMQLSSRDISIL